MYCKSMKWAVTLHFLKPLISNHVFMERSAFHLILHSIGKIVLRQLDKTTGTIYMSASQDEVMKCCFSLVMEKWWVIVKVSLLIYIIRGLSQAQFVSSFKINNFFKTLNVCVLECNGRITGHIEAPC